MSLRSQFSISSHNAPGKFESRQISLQNIPFNTIWYTHLAVAITARKWSYCYRYKSWGFALIKDMNSKFRTSYFLHLMLPRQYWIFLNDFHFQNEGCRSSIGLWLRLLALRNWRLWNTCLKDMSVLLLLVYAVVSAGGLQ